MAITSKQGLENAIKVDVLAKMIPFLEEQFGEVLKVASGEVSIPTINANGEECYFNVKVSVPRGTRDGQPYDGYAAAEDWKLEEEAREDKKRKAEEAKARKIAEAERKKEARKAKKKEKKEEEEGES